MSSKKELFNYIVFGIITTFIGIISFWILNFAIGEKFYLFNNIISWILAVTFAFISNKIWVFGSCNWDFCVLKKEIPTFLFARFFSLLLEELGLFVFVELLKFSVIEIKILSFTITGSLISKIILQIIVVILNYIFSKFLIFRKK